MKKRLLTAVIFSIILASLGLAVVPQKWTVRSYEDFLRGKFDGVSLTADGILTLSPREEKIDGPSDDFYLSSVPAPDGSIYLGTGHEGKIYRMAKEGKVELYFQTAEIDVTCLTLDKKGVLYAGTSPHGKIYKITGQNKSETFFDPSEKYIWDLLFAENGNLLAAVGENGGIYEINPQGEGKLILKAAENHILCLKTDRGGQLIAGSGGNGLIYRLTKSGKTTVIFESPYEEVRSLAVDADGNIYASADGTSSRAKKEELAIPTPVRDTDVKISVSAAAPSPAAGAAQAAALASKTLGGSLAASREPGALYKIAPDGIAKRLWSSAEEVIYSLFLDETEKRIILGTGPKGRIYVLDKDEKLSLVFQKNSEQIYKLWPADSKIYMLANNPSQISAIYPEQRSSGEYLSSVFDAKVIAVWGKIGWEAELPQGATLQFQTRSGNSYEPGASWSDWSPPYQKKEGEQILSPKARYLQFRALLKTQSGKVSPSFSKLTQFYLQTNVAPAFTQLELLSPNEVFLKPIEQEEVIWGLEKRNPDPASAKKDDLKSALAKKVERKGFQTVVWDADDDNDDLISYSISIKQEGEKAWRTLEEQWTETLYTFSTLNFPDGVYFLKITASDGPSNPPDLEKRTDKTSGAFVVDNSPPALENIQILRDKNELTVSFLAEATFSAIKEVKYLIRPDDWRVVFPEDGVCDSKQESFKFKVQLGPKSDNMITILVKDAVNNVAVFRRTF